MNRRMILRMTGASFVTGAVADLDRQDADSSQGQNDGSGGEGSNQQSDCEVTLEFGSGELVVDEDAMIFGTSARIPVRNTGTAASGPITVTVQWQASDGSHLGEDMVQLPSLGAGETWMATVYAFTDEALIADFAVSGEFEVGAPRMPDGLSVGETEYDRGDQEIIGLVENTREHPIESVTALAKITDSEGTVIGGATAWESELGAGSDWTFTIYAPSFPADIDPHSYTVTLDADTFQITG